MEPRIYTADDHHIRNDLIDTHALSVLRRLKDAGFIAYLVGGGVRDLLMRKRPKDFDISTSARPEEIKALFRNCLLIGRRFRLAHIRFGRQIVEVSTFRAGDPQEEELIIQDNLWGSPEEDVLRRDFTINGLFYDPEDHRILDYVGGFEDLTKHLLKTIGDPALRFKQDPVRMIRMQKFRARFGFQVDADTQQAMTECRNEIIKSSPARVLEEIFRMLESGSAEPFFRLLYESEFIKILFPKLHEYFEKETGELLFSYLKAADALSKDTNAPLDRGLLSASLLFPILDLEIKKISAEQGFSPHITEIQNLCFSLIQEVISSATPHFPRRIRLSMQFILQMQYRLTPLDQKKRPRLRLVKQKGFNLCLVFLKLRSLVTSNLFKSYEFWKKHYQNMQLEDSNEGKRRR